MSENELIKDCIKKDRNAQNNLYDLFAGKMFAVCLRYSRSREEAEDIFQDAFMKVYENIKSFRNTGSFEGWIRRIFVNTAIEHFRKKVHPSLMLHIDDHNKWEGNGLVADDILSGIATEELLKLIQQLPPYCKMVFNLFVFEGLKHREIANRLNITEGTSKSHLSDARNMLKKALEKLNKPALKLTYNG